MAILYRHILVESRQHTCHDYSGVIKSDYMMLTSTTISLKKFLCESKQVGNSFNLPATTMGSIGFNRILQL